MRKRRTNSAHLIVFPLLRIAAQAAIISPNNKSPRSYPRGFSYLSSRSAIFCQSSADHFYTFLYDPAVPFCQRRKGSADRSAVNPFQPAKDLLDHRIQIALGRTHFIDNTATIVLNGQRHIHVTLFHQFIKLNIQLGHRTICTANAEYYGITGDKECLARARRAYNLYWDLAHGGKDPVNAGPKTIPETRTGRSFGLPMIILNVISILLRVDPENMAEYEARAQQCVDEIFQYFVKPELKCVLENVGPNGEIRTNFTEGRIVNPGHDIEGVWFLLEHAKRTGDKTLVAKAAEIFDWAIEAGWDNEYGGLLYFVDCMGMPPEAYEHDMKLWWPHNEILIASMMLYCHTRNEKYLNWFYKTLDYCKEHFADEIYGEWYGYLRRDGKPTMPSTKGSTFKGPFHLPRCLILVDQMMGELLA